ncbi:MAG: acetyl-CoA carboxylase biotin carboxyl carrier protein [Hyphomicrobiaceae bacterium]|nr:MAG: acetyl-CoA carboxylase biotin carboxyl carrier protein [Hyphomicrobiaceae bacterium]
MAKDVKGKGSAEQGLIRELAELLDETGLSEIEVEREGLRVRVARRIETIAYAAAPAPSTPQPAAATPSPAPAQKAAPDDPAKHPGCVKSPMVGTAYLAPEPGAPPFVDVGTRVAQGQTIMIIEAMKTMNHIPATKAGTVTAILVTNGQPVEFGEPLAIIE